MNKINDGIFLYHYFEKERGPFRSLSDLSDEKIKEILEYSRIEDKETGKGTLLGSVYSGISLAGRGKR